MDIKIPLNIPLNSGWEFTESFGEEFLSGGGDAVTVSLPHTVREVPYSSFDESIYQMDAAYRKRLEIPEEWRGKRVFLCVGAAGHGAEVYIDGEKIAEHGCGYTSFRTELTGHIEPGKDALIVIRTDTRESLDIPPFGFVIDYLTFGGLYREVWLEIKEQSYIGDVFVMPSVPKDHGQTREKDTPEQIAGKRFDGLLDSRVTINGKGTKLRQSVYAYNSGEEKPLAEQSFDISGETGDYHMELPSAALWDIVSPKLYEVVTELYDGDRLLDSVSTVTGFRRAEFRKNGFYLNGRKVKIMGLNRHQSYPYAGYAMPRSVQRFDADILKKELGVNAVRTSHYPQSHHFISRCDELGLLVFTEIPGWQHIGGESWKEQAVKNTEEMVTQYRNHPSIILWGVRINESRDDDELYKKTGEAARRLDGTRQISGVRCIKKSSLLEDVYAYNDFVHSGDNIGCEAKKAVTSDMKKPYFISEYNGHMFPTKTFDSEEHRLEHALRHANVLDAVASHKDIAGSFGWCMFDYNTHKDFGSGDRICYHGVCDMFRNHKLAAGVYAANQDETPVLEVSSSMEIGEHPASNRGRLFVFTNADEVKMYKNGEYIRSYTHADTSYKHLKRPPIEIGDYIGDQIEKRENFKKKQAKYVKEVLNYASVYGMNNLSFAVKRKAAWLMLRYRMSFDDAYSLYGKYIGNWGDSSVEYRFDAIKDGTVVKSVKKTPMTEVMIRAEASSAELCEGDTYDAALVRIQITDRNGNVLPFAQEAVRFETEGAIELIGPEITVLRGGMGGTFVKTKGESGEGTLVIYSDRTEPVRVEFEVNSNSK